MARTGSGKTAAFVIPLIERLKAHSARAGARAVILSPTRELALQTHKVVKELGRHSDLRTAGGLAAGESGSCCMQLRACRLGCRGRAGVAAAVQLRGRPPGAGIGRRLRGGAWY
jgi:hypothetical protein